MPVNGNKQFSGRFSISSLQKPNSKGCQIYFGMLLSGAARWVLNLLFFLWPFLALSFLLSPTLTMHSATFQPLLYPQRTILQILLHTETNRPTETISNSAIRRSMLSVTTTKTLGYPLPHINSRLGVNCGFPMLQQQTQKIKTENKAIRRPFASNDTYDHYLLSSTLFFP